MRTKKLIDTIQISALLSTGGIFSKIASIENQPFEWLTTTNALQLDKLYYLSHSGDKWISKPFYRFLQLEEDEVINDALLEMANNIILKFADNWNRIFNAWFTEYEPLENYNMHQVETPDITKVRKTGTDLTTEVKKKTDLTTTTSHETDITDEKKTNTNISTDTDVYGFNSSSPVPSGKATTTGLDTNNVETIHRTGEDEKNVDTEHITGLDTDNIDTTHVTGDDTKNIVTEDEDGTRTLDRNGNIGVTTSQQMLQSEIDLRSNFNFTNHLMDDVDSELCLLVY